MNWVYQMSRWPSVGAPTKGQRSKLQLVSFKLSTVAKFKSSTPQLINPILNESGHRILALLKQQRERPENSDLNGDSNPDLCDAGAVLTS